MGAIVIAFHLEWCKVFGDSVHKMLTYAVEMSNGMTAAAVVVVMSCWTVSSTPLTDLSPIAFVSSPKALNYGLLKTELGKQSLSRPS